jgi:hypothetical protein
MRRLTPEERALLKRTIQAMNEECLSKIDAAYARLVEEVERRKAAGYFADPDGVDRILYGGPGEDRRPG